MTHKPYVCCVWPMCSIFACET